MTPPLPTIFDAFVRGEREAESFERELLTLCRAAPDEAWNVLALLDQYHRRRKITAEQYRAMRHKIERQALGIEDYLPLPPPPAAAERPADRSSAALRAVVLQPRAREWHAPYASLPRIGTPSRKKIGWRGFRTTSGVALAMLVLGVAASPAVREIADASAMTEPQPAAPLPPPAVAASPPSVSLSSDRYIVRPDQKVAVLKVERSAETGGDTRFVWWTAAAGARPDEDYVGGPPKNARIVDGAATLYVPIISNPSRRHIEMFYVMIGQPSGGASLGPIHRAAVFILPPG